MKAGNFTATVLTTALVCMIAIISTLLILVAARAAFEPPARPAMPRQAPSSLLPTPPPADQPQAPEITLADLVDILTKYDIVHDPKGHIYESAYYGYTDREHHTIHLLDHGDQADLRDTILHEAGHVKCYAMMVDCDETMIEAMSQTVYRRLYVAKERQ